jgi:hypothetical protein
VNSGKVADFNYMAIKKVGIIAEDKSDVAVIKVLIERLRDAPVSVKHFVGNRCGKIVSKSNAWSKELARAGCRYLVVVHDLDRGNRIDVEARLNRAISESPILHSLILIPVQEIEAWLPSDELAVSNFFNLKPHLKKISNPEDINSPKEKLGQLVYQSTGGKKRYVNSIHNERIVRQVSLIRLRSCQSFIPLEKFVREQVR